MIKLFWMVLVAVGYTAAGLFLGLAYYETAGITFVVTSIWFGIPRLGEGILKGAGTLFRRTPPVEKAT